MNSFFKIIKRFPRTFWIANIMELFERWAWYGMFMIFALYLTGSTDSGALGFSQVQKGILMGSVVGFLYFMPVITGAIADRVGYKKMLIIAYIILSSSYFILGQVKSYESVFFAFIMLAIGAALFKPIISACIAKTTDEQTSSMGFGIFYMIVNIGAFIGPIVASLSRQKNWQYVFMISSAVILINLILVIFFFKDPIKPRKNSNLIEEIIKILKNITEALKDVKFVFFLLIVAGFWTMYNQLFYTLPVFIDQWMDTSIVYENIYKIWPWFAEQIGTADKTIAAEMMTNIDAMYIILFQLLISYLVMRIKPIHSIIAGFLIATIGLSLSFLTHNPIHLFITILIFGIGEMAGSPKTTEYIGKIAPEGKTALYMGCSFLPMAAGNFFAGLISGNVYQKIGDKINIAQMEAIKLGLKIPNISDDFTQNDYLNAVANHLNMNQQQLNEYLWNNYHPYNIWIIIAAIGISTVLALITLNYFLKKN
ncbi:MAG TPA: MFS transporter [Bacteroidales bacterium]|jgi:dipeptide/tripeptide permease|nr:MFS transporter [Bacteroidales bacterium]HOL97169.1 MFS transporter [Bacteroidales bacterium]HOM35461.1 MFS transporter [Bacteroidales bacterium]HPD23048.1 MFS transporter [Bacteroidales bacterium]HRS99336.1 MFS transporter [Bacteroidales bacterium]